MPNIPTDLEPPRTATAPNHRLSLRTLQYEEQYVRDVEIIGIGWSGDASAPFTYLVFDPRADDAERIYWVRGYYVQQIRTA